MSDLCQVADQNSNSIADLLPFTEGPSRRPRREQISLYVEPFIMFPVPAYSSISDVVFLSRSVCSFPLMLAHHVIHHGDPRIASRSSPNKSGRDIE